MWPSWLSPRSDLTLLQIMWWCVTLSAQSKVRPHPFYESCDGVSPSQLSSRSDLTPFANHVMVCDPLSSVQGPTSPFSNYVMVCDPLGSVQGSTSPFSNYVMVCDPLTSPFPNHVMVCDPFGSVQGPISPFSNHVTVYDPLGSVQGPTSPFSNHVMVIEPLDSVQGPTSFFFKSCDGVWPSRLSPRSDLTTAKSQSSFNFCRYPNEISVSIFT